MYLPIHSIIDIYHWKLLRKSVANIFLIFERESHTRYKYQYLELKVHCVRKKIICDTEWKPTTRIYKLTVIYIDDRRRVRELTRSRRGIGLAGMMPRSDWAPVGKVRKSVKVRVSGASWRTDWSLTNSLTTRDKTGRPTSGVADDLLDILNRAGGLRLLSFWTHNYFIWWSGDSSF